MEAGRSLLAARERCRSNRGTGQTSAVLALAIGISDGSVAVVEFLDAQSGADEALFVDCPGATFSTKISSTLVKCDRFESYIPAREGKWYTVRYITPKTDDGKLGAPYAVYSPVTTINVS